MQKLCTSLTCNSCGLNVNRQLTGAATEAQAERPAASDARVCLQGAAAVAVVVVIKAGTNERRVCARLLVCGGALCDVGG